MIITKLTKLIYENQIYIYIYICGAKGFGDLSPFHIKPLAHAEEEEMSEDEQRKSRLPGYTIEDNPVLRRSRSRQGKAPRHQGQSPRAS